MPRTLAAALVAALLAAGPLGAQLSGSYTIDPGGSGPRNYRSFPAASLALAASGISGPVEFVAAGGNYRTPWRLLPTLGSSSTHTITFRSSTLYGAVVDVPTEWMLIHSFQGWRAAHVIVSGFDFRGVRPGASRAIFIIGGRALEIRNCRFRQCALRSTDVIESSVHHCEVENGQISMVGSNCEIHHNRCVDSAAPLYAQADPKGPGRMRIFNNSIWGSWSLAIGEQVDFTHNTVIARHGRSSQLSDHCLYVSTSYNRGPRVTNNVFVNPSGGRLISANGLSMTRWDWTLNANSYWAPKSAVLFRFASRTWGSLDAWKRVTGQEADSLYGDPQLVDLTRSLGLQVKRRSPLIGAAVGTPAYVTDDFAGSARYRPATIGAYEGIPESTFLTFGSGCPGTQGIVPRIGYAGDLRMGSTDFRVTLTNAYGAANHAFLVLGLNRARINLGGTCDLLLLPDIVFGMTVSGSGPGNGSASLGFPLPRGPGYRGSYVHMQWGVVDPAAAGIQIATSGAATLKL